VDYPQRQNVGVPPLRQYAHHVLGGLQQRGPRPIRRPVAERAGGVQTQHRRPGQRGRPAGQYARARAHHQLRTPPRTVARAD
jgi:hypothetical protein